MHVITWSAVRLLFKIWCFTTLAVITSYWFYKFVIEDEDLCLVDYKTVEKAGKFPFPTVSMCFENPFVAKKLKEASPGINTTTYLQFLRGEIFDSKFNDIDYDRVTLNPSEYYLYSIIWWRNGTYSTTTSKTNVVKQRYVTYNGFWFYHFIKCFGMEMSDKYKKEVIQIQSVYKQNEFMGGFSRYSGNAFWVFFHSPQQFLLTNEFQRFSTG